MDFVAGGGGSSFCVTRSGSLLRLWNVSVCARGAETGAETGTGADTSAFEEVAGDGAELESFASRFART